MSNTLFSLEPSLFVGYDSNPTFVLWQYVQTIANVIMVIILLVVIFSQLTGYGIDNYGIKKMLPKIIIAAVLINFSFLLCQVAVDLSNIIGLGFVKLCKDASGVVLGSTGLSLGDIMESGFATLFSVLFAAAGVGTAVLPIGITVTTALAGAGAGGSTLLIWLLPLVLVVLTAIVAVIIFFLMLALRKLLAVVLVILSPVAVVCYILPNTNGLFKKWLNLFKAVLILYPVCGGLYGLSIIMKAIVFSQKGIHIGMLMVAMFFTFLPLLIAPKMLKTSLTAFGNLGAALGNAGDFMKRRMSKAQSQVRDTNAYKDANEKVQAARAQKNAQIARKMEEMKDNNQVKGFGNRLRYLGYRTMVGGGDLNRIISRNSRAAEKYTNSLVDDETVAMKEITGNYNNEQMEGMLLNLLSDEKNFDEKNKDRDKNMISAYALMSKLASQKGGSFKLSDVAAKVKGRGAEIIGKGMARDGRVREALKGSDEAALNRMDDISSGIIGSDVDQETYDNLLYGWVKHVRQARINGTEAMSMEDWKKANPEENETMLEHIARQVASKGSRFLGQSTSAVEKMSNVLNKEEIETLEKNSARYMTSGDAKRENINALKKRKVEIESNDLGEKIIGGAREIIAD